MLRNRLKAVPTFTPGEMSNVTTQDEHCLMEHDIPVISQTINDALIDPVVNFIAECDAVIVDGMELLQIPSILSTRKLIMQFQWHTMLILDPVRL